MKVITHRLYVSGMTLTVLLISVYLFYGGLSYYSLPLEERFYHPQYDYFKPSGIFGQGLGVIGTGMIIFGVAIYILRKRYGLLEKKIRLKYLLEFHIFLCTLGPILVLFHTTFKFGGIVSIAFWSMVAIVLSGVIGRFLYIQIPRTIEGRELTIQEVIEKRDSILNKIQQKININTVTINDILSIDKDKKWGLSTLFKNFQKRQRIKKILSNSLSDKNVKAEILSLIKEEMALSSRIGRLEKMQQFFKLWHVVHMPFALIMLVIVVIHIAVTVSLGYKWIF